MYRGSRKHILDWIEQPTFLPSLLSLVAPIDFRITPASQWAPMGYRWPDEARLEDWGPRTIGASVPWADLQTWWLAAPRGANTPNWDLALTGEIEGRPGLLLIEAKAHASELKADGKDAPTGSSGSSANHERIGRAIEEARQALSLISPSMNIRRDTHYQLANRLAFMWKLASFGLPVVLLYLGFVGDTGISDVGTPFDDRSQWEQLLNAHLAAVGATAIPERRHALGGAPFWLLVRSRTVVEPSAPSASDAL